jgi:glycosyltransferase involved in cell wall biosynthesis
MPSPAAVARVLLLGQSKTVLVHTEHNVWERYRFLTYWANLITYSRNRSVIAVSESVAQSIRRPGPLGLAPMPSVGVIVHGIDIDLMYPCQERRKAARATLGLDDTHMVIGTVGNFTAKKDQKVLLRAAAVLLPRLTSLRIVLVGTGPLEESLRQLAEHLGLTNHVLFAGSRGDVPEILPAFDVFTLTSRFEGLSIALLEAMATGLPCVATRVGGVPEIVVDEETGILVPAGDVAAVAGALERLLGDPVARARMGDAARARARALDARSAVRHIEEVYDAAVMR